MVLSGKQSSILFWKPCSIAMIKIILEVYNEFLSHLRMTLGPELLIGRNANYFYLFGFFRWRFMTARRENISTVIFFLRIFISLFYTKTCVMSSLNFFYLCWINVMLIKHFLVDYLFHLCGDFLFSLGGGCYLPSFKVVCLQNMVGVVYLLIPSPKKVGIFRWILKLKIRS